MRKDGGFRIRTIPGVEPPHRLPYQSTPGEWEVYKEKTQALLTRRLIRKSDAPYAAPVLFVQQDFDEEGKPKIRMVVGFRALNKITVKDRFPLPHPGPHREAAWYEAVHQAELMVRLSPAPLPTGHN